MKKILLLFCFTIITSIELSASKPASTGLIPKKLYAVTTLKNDTLSCDLTNEIPLYENLNEIHLLAMKEAEESLSELRKKYNPEEINKLDPKWFYYNHGRCQLLINQ